jgi:DNA polymerase
MQFHLSHLPAVQAAIAAADACDTLAELTAAVEAFKEHELCASRALPSRPGARCPEEAPVMLLGKSPAWTEHDTGVPFCGPAGQVLRSEMQTQGHDVEECWIGCASPWKAKKNNPNATLLAIARPFLMREIEIVRPRIIMALGQKADEALTQKSQKVTERVGLAWTLRTPRGIEVPVIVNFCHAAVMYDPRLAPEFRSVITTAFDDGPVAAMAA